MRLRRIRLVCAFYLAYARYARAIFPASHSVFKKIKKIDTPSVTNFF